MKILNKRGFTLIELLVVISIIGLLSAIIIASLNTARMKARDAVRKEDLHTIQLALEMYYSNCGTYIVRLNCTGNMYGSGGIGWFDYNYGTGSVAKGLVDNNLTGAEIIDPSGALSSVNAYMIIANKKHYTIWATIEKPSAQDTATLSSCYFTSYTHYSGIGSQNYCVNN